MDRYGSQALLVIANLVPLAGVSLWGWRAFDVILIYWLESVVIGVYTVLKLRKAGARSGFPANFFIVHYGMFSISMLMCIIGYFGPGGFSMRVTASKWNAAIDHMFGQGFLDLTIAAVSFAVSHGYSYRHNFLAKREYEDREYVKRIVHAPYTRLILTIAAIVFTNWAVLKMRMKPDAGVVFLILLKTAADLAAHKKEHSRAFSR